MAVRKDSALYKLLIAMKVELEDDVTLDSISDVEIVDGDLSVAYSYDVKNDYDNTEYHSDDSEDLTLFERNGDGTYCCGSIEIGNFTGFSPDIVIPQVVAAMKNYLHDSKMGLVLATTYHQPGAEKLLKASGFEGKPFYNPSTKHTCTVWTWRRAGGR